MRPIGANVKRGSAELAVLALLERGPLHGYEIAKQIEEQTHGVLRFDVASLYPLLYRMEKRGWVKAHWEESPNGRRRRCYSLSGEGERRLAPLRAQWRAFFQALDQVAGLEHV
jgi:PadR family transcriptional regulator, regulatory protein PadR